MFHHLDHLPVRLQHFRSRVRRRIKVMVEVLLVPAFNSVDRREILVPLVAIVSDASSFARIEATPRA